MTPPTLGSWLSKRSLTQTNEFLGRAVVRPRVVLPGEQPEEEVAADDRLHWITITSGSRRTGDILAALQIVQVSPQHWLLQFFVKLSTIYD